MGGGFLTATLIAMDMTWWVFLAMGARSSAAADQEDTLCRRLRLHYRQLQQPGRDRLPLVCRAGPGRFGSECRRRQLLQPGRCRGRVTAGHDPAEDRATVWLSDVFLNLDTIVVLFFAWLCVVSFFVLAVQLFVTLLEFKLPRWLASCWCRSRCGTRPRSWPNGARQRGVVRIKVLVLR